MRSRLVLAAALLASSLTGALLRATGGQASGIAVSGTVSVRTQSAGAAPERSDVVVWLTPVGDTPRPRVSAARRFKIDQQNKIFTPHVLVVPTGSTVDFPNLDPIFHNVFSLFDGRRFDLGLYEAGTTRSVNFTRPGVCFVFCNIHPEMSAVVVVVDSPYYTMSNAAGAVSLPDVPQGRYRLSVWHERFKPEDPSEFPREVAIGPSSATLGALRFVEASRVPASHKNKFGHDYLPPPPTSPVYP